MASDDERDVAVLNQRFWVLLCASFDRDEIQALRDFAGEVERLNATQRDGDIAPAKATNRRLAAEATTRLITRIGWYTRP